MDKEQVREIFRQEIERYFSGRFIVKSHMQLFDGRNIQTGNKTGTKIGTEATQKLGFFGATPVPQPSAPTDAASIISALQDLGLVA